MEHFILSITIAILSDGYWSELKCLKMQMLLQVNWLLMSQFLYLKAWEIQTISSWHKFKHLDRTNPHWRGKGCYLCRNSDYQELFTCSWQHSLFKTYLLFLADYKISSYSWWHKAVWFPEGTFSVKSNRQYLVCERKADLHLQLSILKKKKNSKNGFLIYTSKWKALWCLWFPAANSCFGWYQ